MIKFILVLLVALVAQNDGTLLPFLHLDGRIVGGSTTPIEQLPYQLSLEARGNHTCGAIIISRFWCITSAHCVSGWHASKFTLRAGSSIIESGGTVHQAIRNVVHPNYNRGKKDYDYALLKVKQPFPLGQPGVAAIKMAEEEPREGAKAVTSGWGSLSPGGSLSSELQSVEVPMLSRKYCQSRYSTWDITERMVCAGFKKEGGRDYCRGDAGGPLVVNGQLVGVVSWGRGCANPKSPGVYSNVADQRSWIRKVTGV